MTTKQELFEKYIVAAVNREDWRAAWFAERHSYDAMRSIYRAVRRSISARCNTPERFTRACNFVSRQLGIWEER